jgi:hypothetical protein
MLSTFLNTCKREKVKAEYQGPNDKIENAGALLNACVNARVQAQLAQFGNKDLNKDR